MAEAAVLPLILFGASTALQVGGQIAQGAAQASQAGHESDVAQAQADYIKKTAEERSAADIASAGKELSLETTQAKQEGAARAGAALAGAGAGGVEAGGSVSDVSKGIGVQTEQVLSGINLRYEQTISQINREKEDALFKATQMSDEAGYMKANQWQNWWGAGLGAAGSLLGGALQTYQYGHKEGWPGW